MKLQELWNVDIDRAYSLFMDFPECDNGFENIAYGLDHNAFISLVEKKRQNSLGLELPEGFVPDTVYILIDDDGEYVGIFNFRHYLNGFLANGPGHIGFGISPCFRRRGYAVEGLKLLVKLVSPVVREDEIYLSCNRDNPVSLKVQLAAGGRIHHETDELYLVRIAKSL